VSKRSTADLIAIVLASGLSLAVVSLVIGVVWAAVAHGNTAASLSENEAAVLTTAFGAMAGILGAWVGYHHANSHQEQEPEPPWPELPPEERTLPRPKP
jgi:hypothetical protein